MNHTLTVFTPAYNRSHTIGRTYESLCRQTCKDFEWLIVDDGSKDNTRELVEGWIAENRIPIRYIYQENQGMHGAHNTAYRNITTELNTCIDSDDYMPDDAVETIITFWKEHGSEEYAGIVGLDITIDGKVIGDTLDNQPPAIHFYEQSLKGDKKMVLRTDLAKKYPEYPLFEGERYVGTGYNMFNQWWKNPKGFAFIHNNDLLYVHNPKRRFIVATHYVSHCIRAKQFGRIFKSNAPLLTTLCIPSGLLLFVFTWWRVKRGGKLRFKV